MTPTTCACGHRPTTVEYVYLRTTPVYFVHCNQCFACGPSAATEERAVTRWNDGERITDTQEAQP